MDLTRIHHNRVMTTPSSGGMRIYSRKTIVETTFSQSEFRKNRNSLSTIGVSSISKRTLNGCLYQKWLPTWFSTDWHDLQQHRHPFEHTSNNFEMLTSLTNITEKNNTLPVQRLQPRETILHSGFIIPCAQSVRSHGELFRGMVHLHLIHPRMARSASKIWSKRHQQAVEQTEIFRKEELRHKWRMTCILIYTRNVQWDWP